MGPRHYDLANADDETRNNFDIVKAEVEKNGLMLGFASEELKSNKAIVLAAVEQNGLALQFASERLRNDIDVIVPAINQNEMAIFIHGNSIEELYSYINDKFINSIFPNQILENQGEVRSKLSDLKIYTGSIANKFYYNFNTFPNTETLFEIKKNLALHFVENRGDLAHLDEEFRNDRDVVLAAVNKNGRFLEFASEELRNDRGVVLAALESNPLALEYASEGLRNDPEIVYL